MNLNNINIVMDHEGVIDNKKVDLVKIFNCSNCRHKCTDLQLHKAHMANCSSSAQGPKNGFYKCGVCLYIFKDEQKLICHENKHFYDKTFDCNICELGFMTIDTLYRHFVANHKTSGKTCIFSCNVCDYSSHNKFRVKRHIVTHNIDRALYCPYCEKNFENLNELNEHSYTIHHKPMPEENKQKVEQEVNGITNVRDTEDILKELKNNFMEKTTWRNGYYYCNGCSYKFKDLVSMKNHKVQHLNVQAPYQCSKCIFVSFCVDEVKIHLLAHNNKTITVPCNICNIGLKFGQIKKHAVFHVNDGFFCFSCSLNFVTAEDYQQHVSNRHTKIINEIKTCSKCGFSNVDSNKYEEHLKTHSLYITHSKNLKKNKSTKCKTKKVSSIFSCSKCSFKCSNIDSLQKHYRSHHNRRSCVWRCNQCNWNKSCKVHIYFQHMELHNTNKILYSCCFCDYQSSLKARFNNHMSSHWYINCPYCDFKSQHFKIMKKHLVGQHNPDRGPITCTLCPYSTAIKSKLNTHCIKFHSKEFISLRLSIPLNLLNAKGNGCGLCTYKSQSSSNLKRHVCTHFANGSLRLNSLKQESAENVKQIATSGLKTTEELTVVETLQTKTGSKVQKQTESEKKNMITESQFDFSSTSCRLPSNKNVIETKISLKHNSNDMIFNGNILHLQTANQHLNKSTCSTIKNCYCCKLCDFNSLSYHEVSQHLIDYHNVENEGVRNQQTLIVEGSLQPNYLQTITTKLVKTNMHDESIKKITTHTNQENNNSVIKKLSKCNIQLWSKKKSGHKLFLEKSYACRSPNCTSKYKHRSSLRKHEKICCQIKDDIWPCGACDYVTNDMADLVQHLFTHSGIPE